MSYFSQMVALASHNFWSAAVGIAIAAALVRGIARDKAKTIGNFWVDLVRVHLYLLIPICIVYALFLVSQGMIQNFQPYDAVTVLDQSAAAGRDGHAIDRPGPGRVADRDQDARHQRRRLLQRQRRVSLREPDAAEQLHPDPLDLRDPQRADLLPRPAW